MLELASEIAWRVHQLTDQTTGSSEVAADLDAALEGLEHKVEGSSSRQAVGSSDPKIGAGLLIVALVSFVAIGMAAYGVYQFYQLDGKIIELVAAVADVEQSVGNFESKQNAVAADLQRFGAQLSAQIASLDEKLNSALADIRASAGSSSTDWILAEVEYLLRLANQRIMMEKEVSGAIALLHAADKIIDQADIVSAFPVRQAIAEDIASLKSLGQLDIEGTYLKLAARTRQVEHLKRKKLAFISSHVDNDVTEPDEADENRNWYQELLHASVMLGDRLYSLVNYRQGTERVQPILPPKEEYYLRQNLKLKFGHAQLALLRNQQAAFDQSVADSIDWVETHFDQQDTETEAMLSTLREIANVRVEQAIADISGSLAAIRKYLAEFHLVPAKNSQREPE